MTTDSLHPRIAEVIDELTSAQQQMLDTIGAMSAEHRDAPSNDGRWSIAQIAEHVMMVEGSIAGLVVNLIAQTEGTLESDDSPVRHSLDEFRIPEPAHRRLEAPGIVVPSAGLPVNESLAKQAAVRGQLIESFRLASGRGLAAVEFTHPLFGPMNVYQWGLFIAQHQRRHVVQMQALQSGLLDR